jgi:cathepsin D
LVADVNDNAGAPFDFEDSENPLSKEETSDLLRPSSNYSLPEAPIKMALANQNDIYYLMTILLTGEEEAYSIVPDTGSFKFWISDSSCINCNNSRKLFNCSAPDSKCQKHISDGENPEKGIRYAVGSIKGTSALLDFTLQGYSSLSKASKYSITAFKTLLITETLSNPCIKMLAYDCPIFDGLMGLSQSDIRDDNFPSVLNTLISQSLIQRPVFSLYMSHFRDERDKGEPSSEIAFGGYNPGLVDKESLRWHPLTSSVFWSINVDRYSFGNRTLLSDVKMNAVLDSGCTFIVLPQRDFALLLDSFIMNFTVECSPIEHRSRVHNCSGPLHLLEPLEFFIGGFKYVLPSERYLIDGQLFLVPQGRDLDELTLGMVFLREYYTVYDLESKLVGIGKLTTSENASVPIEVEENWMVFSRESQEGAEQEKANALRRRGRRQEGPLTRYHEMVLVSGGGAIGILVVVLVCLWRKKRLCKETRQNELTCLEQPISTPNPDARN